MFLWHSNLCSIRYYVYTTIVASMKKSYGVVIEKYQSQYSPIKKFQSSK